MASWIRPDHEGIERPMDRHRARGQQLSNERIIRIRDLLAVLLVEGMGLSLPDTRRVLRSAPITEDHIRRRLAKCPKNVRDVVREFHQEGGN